jgi:hypothetical protein
MITPEEMQTKQLEMQQKSIRWNMYIGIAGLIISALGLYWTTRSDRNR